MTTSGIYQDSFNRPVYCKNCLFEGDNEVFFDPEIHSAWTTCPICKDEFDIPFEDVMGHYDD